jgi:hypothetical protein
MKKLLCLLLVGAMMLPLLIGCDISMPQTDEPTEPPTEPVLCTTHTYKNGVCSICGKKNPYTILLRYDDHMDMSERSVEIIDSGVPSSYQVGYGLEKNAVADTAVVEMKDGILVATGIGEATVCIDGTAYEVIVNPAPISLLLLIGQSNMRGSEGNADQSIVCPDGMVYATYGDDRGASNTAMTVSNAHLFAPSALAGNFNTVNTAGTTECLAGYPVNTLTEAGEGKIGPDSGFAYEWVKQTGEKVWVVNAAHGGSTIATWLDGGTNYEECVRLFQACQQTLQKEIDAGHYTLSHMGYFWCQGCSDRTMTAQGYVEKFLSMHNSLKVDLKHNGRTFEFCGIIPVRVGSSGTCYRDGTYETANPYSYHASYQDLRFNGPRVAQYWMCNNPALQDIWMACNIGDDWVWMPDGTNGVSDYFEAHYPNGTVNYITQKSQKASWCTPKTPKDVHDSIHYNQIGYNEIGRESVRNMLVVLGEIEAPDVEMEVNLLTWDGFTKADKVTASTQGNNNTLIVPKVYPLWRTKEITYSLSDGLSWKYYDILAENSGVRGVLTVNGAVISVENGIRVTFFSEKGMAKSLSPGRNLYRIFCQRLFRCSL